MYHLKSESFNMLKSKQRIINLKNKNTFKVILAFIKIQPKKVQKVLKNYYYLNETHIIYRIY